MNKFDNLISLHDAAKEYGKHESTLKTLIARGKFEIGKDVKKFGNSWVFDREALNKKYNK